VLNFDSHQQEVYLPYNDIFQVVSEEEKVEEVRWWCNSCPFVSVGSTLLGLCMLVEGLVAVNTHPSSHPRCHGGMVS
jgi:hypothetical protein